MVRLRFAGDRGCDDNEERTSYFLDRLQGDKAPFNGLESTASWAARLGHNGLRFWLLTFAYKPKDFSVFRQVHLGCFDHPLPEVE